MSQGSSMQLDPQKARMLASPWYGFGQKFNNLTVYGRPVSFAVVNERAVRATAGIMMVLAAIAISFAYFDQNFLLVRIISVIFVVDYALRQIAGLTPLSPIGMLGTFLVNNQQPEWVGTSQKRFAWALGLIMALAIAILTNLGILMSLVPALGVLFIALLWLESVVGACVGCKIYSFLIKANLIHPEDAPACGGNACQIAPSRTQV
jgi:hypothetical protein